MSRSLFNKLDITSSNSPSLAMSFTAAGSTTEVAGIPTRGKNRLQRLAKVVTHGGEEARLAEIGAFGLLLRGLECRADMLAVGYIVDGQEGSLLARGHGRDIRRIQRKHAASARGQIDFDFVVFDHVMFAPRSDRGSCGAPARRDSGREAPAAAGRPRFPA